MIHEAEITIECNECGEMSTVTVNVFCGELSRRDLEKAIKEEGWEVRSHFGRDDHICGSCIEKLTGPDADDEPDEGDEESEAP